MGNAHPNVVPYQTFPTKDGDVIIAIGNDSQFKKFCEAAGIPETGNDSRYASNALRIGRQPRYLHCSHRTGSQTEDHRGMDRRARTAGCALRPDPPP